MTLTFHADRNSRKADYAGLKGGYLVTKVFPTLQGEGPLAGQFAVFVRLAGCNLGAKKSCPWCDTDFRIGNGKLMTALEVLDLAEGMHQTKYKNNDKLMVLTGGEPLLQNPHYLVNLFLMKGWRVQVETNGYFWPKDMADIKLRHASRFMIVVSPKVNTRNYYPNLNPDLISDSDCLKILISADPASPYFYLPSYVASYKLQAKPIYLSPINEYAREPRPNEHTVTFWGDSPLDKDKCRLNYQYATHLAMRHGFRLSLQTHLFAEVE